MGNLILTANFASCIALILAFFAFNCAAERSAMDDITWYEYAFLLRATGKMNDVVVLHCCLRCEGNGDDDKSSEDEDDD